MKVGRLFREGMVNAIKEGVEKSNNAFVVNFNTMPARKATEFRKSMRLKKANVYLTKNKIAGLALKEFSAEDIAKGLKGQTAFVWSDCDAAEISKELVNFAKEIESFQVRGGFLDGAILSGNDVKRLSDLPAKEVLIAQLLGTIQSPLTRLASVLNGNSRDLLSVLKQLSEQKGGN